MVLIARVSSYLQSTIPTIGRASFLIGSDTATILLMVRTVSLQDKFATRIRCVDWSQIDKNEYLAAMRESVVDSTHIKALPVGALTDKINDREMFMKGIDYSYYYEKE